MLCLLVPLTILYFSRCDFIAKLIGFWRVQRTCQNRNHQLHVVQKPKSSFFFPKFFQAKRDAKINYADSVVTQDDTENKQKIDYFYEMYSLKSLERESGRVEQDI